MRRSSSVPAGAPPQVDELVVIANVAGSVPDGVTAVHNDRPLGFAANLNKGLTLTTGDAVLSVNPDTVPAPDAVAGWSRFSSRAPAPVSSGRAWCIPTGRSSRRGGASRQSPGRSCGGRRSVASSRSAATSTSTRRCRRSRCGSTGCSAAFLLLRRSMLDELGGFDPGFRLYGEDIDLRTARRGRAGSAGTCRARSYGTSTRPRPTGGGSRGARSGTGAVSRASSGSIPSACARSGDRAPRDRPERPVAAHTKPPRRNHA